MYIHQHMQIKAAKQYKGRWWWENYKGKCRRRYGKQTMKPSQVRKTNQGEKSPNEEMAKRVDTKTSVKENLI